MLHYEFMTLVWAEHMSWEILGVEVSNIQHFILK